MVNLLETIKWAEKKKIAIGHFNFSTLDQFKAIVETAKKLNLPVILGISEGERDFVGLKNAVSLVKNAREDLKIPIFLNADHTYDLEKVKKAAEAGCDSIIFDGAKLSLEENITKTKEAVKIVKRINRKIIMEAEIGYIGQSSGILKELPSGATIEEKDLPAPEMALKFVKETKVDMLAPAVGNIHGMFKNTPNPNLNIERIKTIKKAVKIPLVLHGGSGVKDDDFKEAIAAGISIIHISTELRSVWRKGIETALENKPDEVAPYKLLAKSEELTKEVVKNRLMLFSPDTL